VKLSTTSTPHTRKLITLADFRLSSRFGLQTLPENNVQQQYKKSHHPLRSIYEPGVPTTALKYSVSSKQQLPEIFNLMVTYGHCSFLSQLAGPLLVTLHLRQVLMNAVSFQDTFLRSLNYTQQAGLR
jgi:hypothetical protein